MGSDEMKADISAIKLGPLKALVGAPTRAAVAGAQEQAPPPRSAFTRLFRELMLFRDPPDHTRLRSLVNKAFTPRAIGALEDRIAEITHQQLDSIMSRGSMEFLADFAYPVPALTICELMGAPPTDHSIIVKHAPALATGLDPSPMRTAAVRARADRAVEELSGYLDGLISARRREPGDDVLSALIAAEDQGDRLSHDELIATAMLLLIAGHETTANLLGNGLLALLRHREQWDRLRHDRSLDRSAVEELMRFDGPIQMTERISLADVEVGSAQIPKGRIVVLCLAAANRDPAVFQRPHQLDLGRDPNPHVGFGSGAHFCVGAPLARLEARVALRVLAERLPELRLAEERVRWRPSFSIRGLQALPLTW
jgi:hypothetical protein